MTERRQEVARKVVLSALVIDGVLLLAFFVMFGRFDNSIGTPLDPLLRGITCALPFAIAAARVKSGRLLERTQFAQILAWSTAFLVPFVAFFFLPIGSGSSYDYILIAFCSLQLLIPAAVQWGRGSAAFLGTFGTMAGILVVALAYAVHRM